MYNSFIIVGNIKTDDRANNQATIALVFRAYFKKTLLSVLFYEAILE